MEGSDLVDSIPMREVGICSFIYVYKSLSDCVILSSNTHITDELL